MSDGLRARLLTIVVVIVALVILPVALIADAYLERKTRDEAEAALRSLALLADGLVDAQYAMLRSGLAQQADVLEGHFQVRSAAVAGAPDGGWTTEGVPVSSRFSDLSIHGNDARGTLAAALLREQGGRFRVLASTQWGDDGIAPVLVLERNVLAMLERGQRASLQLSIRTHRYLVELLPVRTKDGMLLGLYLLGLDLDRALAPVKDSLRAFVVGDSGYLYVVDGNPGPDEGRFLIHPTQQGNKLTDAAGGSADLNAALLTQREGVFDYAWQNTELGEQSPRDKLVAFRRNQALGWVIGVSGYVDEFGRSAVQLRHRVVIASLLMAAVLMLCLNQAIRRMVILPMLRLQRTLRTLSRGNETLVHSEGEQSLVRGICHVLVNTGGFRCAFIECLSPSGALEWTAAAGDTGPFQRWLGQPEGAQEMPGGRALSQQRTVHYASLEACPAALRPVAAQAGCQALIAFPLLGGDRMLGVLTIGAARASDLDMAGVALLRELAEDLGYGIGNLRNARARDVAESLLRLRERAIEATRDGVLILRTEGGCFAVRDANPAAASILGASREALTGHTLDKIGTFDADGVLALERAFRLHRSSVLELEGVRADGVGFHIECAISPMLAEGECVVMVMQDVTERVLYLKQLEHQARFDPLTELPNRSLLDDRLEQAIIAARRHDSLLGVAFIDLDNFKNINDNLGHRTGDRLLCEVAARIHEGLRDGDTAARLGGDEFVVLLPELGSEEQAYLVLQRVQQALLRPIQIDEHQFIVTASVGVSLYPPDGSDGETLLKHADIAMYHAKESGRDAIRFFTAEMNEQVHDRLLLEQALRTALERDEFHLAYQAQVDSASGRCIGVEALLRWQHPELGAVSPARFIPVAEALGLIEPIGEWVLRTACRQARTWQEAGRPLRVAVNVSARQFRNQDFPERVAAVLEETGLPPTLLELELTESMLMGQAERAELMLRRLKQLDITLSLDDFGTGYSSFSYLQRFPIDTLKVDQSFVRAMLTGSRAVSIVAAIVAMAHSLGMRVIAEGVELASQRRQLVELECDELQGYLYGRPQPAEVLELPG